MESRLFLVACIMYAFTLTSRYLYKKNKLNTPKKFALWNASFLFIILSCALYVFLFIMSGGEFISRYKIVFGELGILLCSLFGYFNAKRRYATHKDEYKKSNLEWSNTVYFAGFVASFIMFFFVQAFKIPSSSMEDTLLIGDHLFVNKAAYGFRIPLTSIRFGEFNQIEKGDIIVFRFPAKDKKQENCGGYQYGKDYVKRVIAVAGDKVEVKEGKLFVNNKEQSVQPYEKYEQVERLSFKDEMSPEEYQTLWENHELDRYYGLYLRDQFGPVVVPDGSYFTMGDNRDNSCDSRFWGPVPRENIKGKAWFIHWPVNRIRLIK